MSQPEIEKRMKESKEFAEKIKRLQKIKKEREFLKKLRQRYR